MQLKVVSECEILLPQKDGVGGRERKGSTLLNLNCWSQRPGVSRGEEMWLRPLGTCAPN